VYQERDRVDLDPDRMYRYENLRRKVADPDSIDWVRIKMGSISVFRMRRTAILPPFQMFPEGRLPSASLIGR
jgi:hypothetical protein